MRTCAACSSGSLRRRSWLPSGRSSIAARRRGEARRRSWRAVRGGAKGLAIALVVGGAFAFVAFDALFETFHRLFFAGGSYSFDPSTERLVQLFPFQFWQETAIAVGAVCIVVAVIVAAVASRRLAARTAILRPRRPSRARGRERRPPADGRGSARTGLRRDRRPDRTRARLAVRGARSGGRGARHESDLAATLGQLGDGWLRDPGGRCRRRRPRTRRPPSRSSARCGRVSHPRRPSGAARRSGSRPARPCPPGADAVIQVEATTPLDATGAAAGERGRDATGPLPAADRRPRGHAGRRLDPAAGQRPQRRRADHRCGHGRHACGHRAGGGCRTRAACTSTAGRTSASWRPATRSAAAAASSVRPASLTPTDRR